MSITTMETIPAGRTPLASISRRQHIGIRPLAYLVEMSGIQPVGRHRGMVLYSPERLTEEFAALGLPPGTPATVPVLRDRYRATRVCGRCHQRVNRKELAAGEHTCAS
jgi:hypothetical protein